MEVMCPTSKVTFPKYLLIEDPSNIKGDSLSQNDPILESKDIMKINYCIISSLYLCVYYISKNGPRKLKHRIKKRSTHFINEAHQV